MFDVITPVQMSCSMRCQAKSRLASWKLKSLIFFDLKFVLDLEVVLTLADSALVSTWHYINSLDLYD